MEVWFAKSKYVNKCHVKVTVYYTLILWTTMKKALLEKAREKERSGSENREKKEGKIEEKK